MHGFTPINPCRDACVRPGECAPLMLNLFKPDPCDRSPVRPPNPCYPPPTPKPPCGCGWEKPKCDWERPDFDCNCAQPVKLTNPWNPCECVYVTLCVDECGNLVVRVKRPDDPRPRKYCGRR